MEHPHLSSGCTLDNTALSNILSSASHVNTTPGFYRSPYNPEELQKPRAQQFSSMVTWHIKTMPRDRRTAQVKQSARLQLNNCAGWWMPVSTLASDLPAKLHNLLRADGPSSCKYLAVGKACKYGPIQTSWLKRECTGSHLLPHHTPASDPKDRTCNCLGELQQLARPE